MTSSTLPSSDISRLENVLQRLNTQIPLILAPIGIVLVTFGEVTSTRWAELSGAITGVAGALIAAILSILTATTTTPNSQVVAKSVIDSRSGTLSWVAGAAHPASDGTPLDPSIGLSALQAAATGLRSGDLVSASSLGSSSDSDSAHASVGITVSAAPSSVLEADGSAGTTDSDADEQVGTDESGDDDDIDLTSTDLDGDTPVVAGAGDAGAERAIELSPTDSSRPRNS